MLRIVFSKIRLSDDRVPDPHTSRQMVEWTRDILLELDVLISEKQKNDGD